MTEPSPAASYAWLPPHQNFVEPVQAVPLTGHTGPLWDTVTDFHGDPVDEMPSCEVTLHHPDAGPIQALVAVQDLRGRWEERPSQAFVEATGFNPDRTWSEIAEERHSWTVKVRELADRLTGLGIPRARRHYAGRGGTSQDIRRQLDASLALGNDEMELLISLAERGNT